MRTTVILLVLLAALPLAGQPLPTDVVTVGTVAGASGATVDVPVYIRDTSGTPLGIDQPSGSRIQSYGLTVNYSPAASVQSISFTRGGITVPLTPTFESSPSTPGTVTLIDTFQESTNLIPFVSNKLLPGDQVGILHVTVSPAAAIPSTITLTLDPTLTQLANQAGTITENTASGNLTLVNGAINITSSIPMLSPWVLALLALSFAVIAVPLLRRS
jgi:hypothetical protein